VRILLVFLAIMAVAGAVAILLALGTLRRNTGLDFATADGATVVASDVGIGPSLLLRDDELGLCGKPDYLLDSPGVAGNRLVPLEVKPNRRSSRLYDSDRIQIGAYLVALKATADDRASSIGYVQLSDAYVRSRAHAEARRGDTITGCRSSPGTSRSRGPS
jgi:hypothetical protein